MTHPPHLPTTPPAAPSRRPRPAVRTAAALAVLGLLATAALAPGWATTRTATPDTSSPPVTPPTHPRTAPCEIPAPLTAAQLRVLAARTAATPPTVLPAPQPAAQVLPAVAAEAGCDVPGRFAFVRLRQWAADTSVQGGHATSHVVLFEQRHWRADDGSGRETSLRYPPGPQPTTDDTYLPGNLDGPIGPIAATPAALTAQITSIAPPFLGAPAVLDAVAGLTRWRTPNRDARTAILTLLRHTDRLTYHGAVRDRAGRVGVGISATSDHGTVRSLLILNPTTGEILAYERAHFPPPQDERSPTGQVEDYLLFTAHTRTSTSHTP
ncbi:hypothetical protein B0E53_01328 [Micromonospora sp. MH33]|uniref:hypothetical protein n=1 Tax=Micromonospora sp. MH33 TaxID=1945509 RepID=UPI000D2BB7B7|nr:hypothetical protein [Micromonospora sp. MH33]PSK66687.1 hypothetical protein B0E53_01328 [Micromonospora sp. MH33]